MKYSPAHFLGGEMPSVFLVVGSRLLREALANLLKKKGDFKVCRVCSCLADATATVAASGAEVLILDSITARQSDCISVAEITEASPNIGVLFIDMDDDPELFLECIRAGAIGYLLKDASASEVVSAVRAVARGQAVSPPHLCRQLFRAFSRQFSALPGARTKLEFGLTRRQQQLIPLIAQGFTNKEIAAHLSLTEQTVKNHLRGIMRRVGAEDRLQVIDLTRLSGALR